MAIGYSYEVTGSAAAEQTFTASGNVSVANAGQFMDAVEMAMREAFVQLTQGRAVYGKPGVGCRGPYRLTKLVIAEKV